MGWFGSKKSGRFEVVANTGIRVQENYTYYLGLDGNVWRTDENNGPEMVAVSGVSPADGFLYFIQEESGNIARCPMPLDFYDLPSVLVDFSKSERLSVTKFLEEHDREFFAQGTEHGRESVLKEAQECEKNSDFPKAITLYEIINMPEEVARVRRLEVLEKAQEREKHLDYQRAIELYESIEMPEEAARVRKLMAEQGAVKVDQTVVHGDYVDDRDTIIKDSVISKSNVGAGGEDKFTKLKELKEMLSEGLIDEDEFKQMKKEILGK
jgi:hypothetical protein